MKLVNPRFHIVHKIGVFLGAQIFWTHVCGSVFLET
jgi:hypothetical protein